MSRQYPDPPRRVLVKAVFGALLGAIAGGLIGAALNSQTWLVWAFAGAVLLALVELITDKWRIESKPKPFAYRLSVAIFFAAAYGAAISLLWPDLGLIYVALLVGLPSGILALNWRNLLLAAAIALGFGWLATAFAPALSPVWLSALITLAYRLSSAALLPRQEPLRLAAEQVPVADVPFVVPFSAHSAYVGANYFADLAERENGRFQRNPAAIGILSSLELLRGPTFDPDLIDPQIRDFYEHTSAYKLSIIPVWVPYMKPLFLLYKRFVAQRIGQANLPFNQEEAQRGIVSYIDTIDFSGEGIVDVRGWVRAFEETGEAIYVGVYTSFRHEGTGFVSVGFPLPESNFTATLLPYNLRDSDFMLKTRDTNLPFPGHYVSFQDEESGNLTVLALPTFHEEIEVGVRDGQLRTNHRFYLGNRLFLTLLYDMQRTAEGTD